MANTANSASQILEILKPHLAEAGIDIDQITTNCASGAKIAAVCVVPDLGDSVKDLAKAPRDHVVMVRVDQKTGSVLDDWVESGAVKSRSEAAALFINEGLKMHESKLTELKGALQEVEKAKKKLQDKVRDVINVEKNKPVQETD